NRRIGIERNGVNTGKRIHKGAFEVFIPSQPGDGVLARSVEGVGNRSVDPFRGKPVDPYSFDRGGAVAYGIRHRNAMSMRRVKHLELLADVHVAGARSSRRVEAYCGF